MTNKLIAQIWFAIIGMAFIWGLLGQPTTSLGFLVIQGGSIIFSVWGMVRLWKSENTNK
jgi:hypothetical protein